MTVDDKLVLIVEDEPDNREITRIAMEELVGARTALAADGEEAVERAQQLKPSLVLLDLMLPKLNGFDVARRLKADPATRSIPVIALTALSRLQDREEAIAAGCDDFVDKPFDLDTLAEKVRKYLRCRPSAIPNG